jgi:hypothetical protein
MAKYTQDATKNRPPIGVMGPTTCLSVFGNMSANVSKYKEPENPKIPERNNILNVFKAFSPFKT